jgi:hypothetical protein
MGFCVRLSDLESFVQTEDSPQDFTAHVAGGPARAQKMPLHNYFVRIFGKQTMGCFRKGNNKPEQDGASQPAKKWG